jgi:hypothetical protein
VGSTPPPAGSEGALLTGVPRVAGGSIDPGVLTPSRAAASCAVPPVGSGAGGLPLGGGIATGPLELSSADDVACSGAGEPQPQSATAAKAPATQART